MRKRIFALLLCLTLCLTMMPTEAFAEAPLPEIARVNIKNFVMPTAGGRVADSIPANEDFEFFDSEGNIITDGITVSSPYYLSFDEYGNYQLVEATGSFEQKTVYFLCLSIDSDYTKVVVSRNRESYTGAFTVNGNDFNDFAELGGYIDGIDGNVLFDLREKSIDIEDEVFSFYPIMGTKVKDNQMSVNNGSLFYDSRGVVRYDSVNDDWVTMGADDIFEPGVRYGYSASFFNSEYQYTSRDKIGPFDGVYRAKTTFNNETIDIYYTLYMNGFAGIEVELGEIRESFSVTYNANGHGIAPGNETVIPGGKITRPNDLTEDGYCFEGWFTDEACTKEYDFGKNVYADVVLFAKWTENSPMPEPAESYYQSLLDKLAIYSVTGEKGIIEWSAGDALPLEVIELLKKTNAIIEFKCTYEGKSYDVFISKYNAPVEKENWYGILYLVGLKNSSSAELAAVESVAADDSDKYIVKRGDTLSKIAKKYKTTLRYLLSKNKNITNPNLIYTGQVILLK